jgi:hypothetical protein
VRLKGSNRNTHGCKDQGDVYELVPPPPSLISQPAHGGHGRFFFAQKRNRKGKIMSIVTKRASSV